MKTDAIILNETTALKSEDGQCKRSILIAGYIKKLFFTMVTTVASLITNAQSIEEQARKAGNEVFATAMIRNIMIVLGVIILFAFLKSGKSSKKSDNL